MGLVARLVVPRISRNDLPVLLGASFLGAFLAGIYGIVHDQWTFAIGPEYFTKMKFQQFHYANFGLGDRVFASTVGFLGTWWVGGVLGWLLARRLAPDQARADAWRQLRAAFAIVFVTALIFAVAGYAYGLWRGPGGDFGFWSRVLGHFQVEDAYAFVRVAYIHNAGYAGGFVGFVTALMFVRPPRKNA